jgi:molecular chaperone Hsp33
VSLGAEAIAERLAPVGDDAVRPFAVEALDVRGRAIQMGPALDSILSRHDYPAAVSRVLAEAVVLAVLLGSSLKFDGKFIMQAETDGAIDLLVADYRSNGAVRAYARFDRERIAAAVAAGSLLGSGVLAMTVDQGGASSRYQGVVPLEGDDLEAAAHTYFRQSEQIPTRVRLAVAEMQTRDGGAVRHAWRAGGVLVQFLPEAPERMRQADLPGGDRPAALAAADGPGEDDAWIEAQALVGTARDDELTDPTVPVERLLYRLFNQRGVRVFRSLAVRHDCSCSRRKVSGVLGTFSAEEIAESARDGAITVTCEFCGRHYRFDPADFPPAGLPSA